LPCPPPYSFEIPPYIPVCLCLDVVISRLKYSWSACGFWGVVGDGHSINVFRGVFANLLLILDT
jgi:hypothetical protein